MSSKRNRNKKAWSKKRRGRGRSDGNPRPPLAAPFAAVPSPRRTPKDLDQIGVVIVEEQLGLDHTSLDALRELTSTLPFEPSMSLLAMLAGRVEQTVRKPQLQLAVAEEFFGPIELVARYRSIVAHDPQAHPFAPQSLYTLMRLLVESAYDAPIAQELTDDERASLLRAVVASNSVIERGIDSSVGPENLDLLAYELQVGSYYTRPSLMEEMVRHRELYVLATTDPELQQSADFEPVQEWLERSELTVKEQWVLGFGLSSMANAWDGTKHPHVPHEQVEELLTKAHLDDRRQPALAAISAERAELQTAFTQLRADGKRFIWELRPFKATPFLRLQDDGGQLLLGRPWIQSWLGEGLHYRAMRVAQAEDAREADGRKNHVQRFTAFAGQVFEEYCLRLARDAMPDPVTVHGEQNYGKGGGQKTSDVAVVDGTDLILFEANARRVGAEPILTGDPLDATHELTKLLVKKIDQLGVSVAVLLSGEAELPDVDITNVERIFPVVVAAGHVWQTQELWSYLRGASDDEKSQSFEDPRVQPLQVLDAGDYEKLLALAATGHSVGTMLARKTRGDFRDRDLAVWLHEDPEAPDHRARLPQIEATFRAMTHELTGVFGPPTDGS